KGEGRDKAKPKDARFTFTTAGTITKSLAGTASVTGTLQSTEDATDQWVVTLNLGQGYSWEEWKAMGNTFKGEWWEVKDLYKDWTYYNLQSGSLTGVGRNAGETVSLSNGHEKFGFQSGIGANLVNGNNGMAGWFEYENRKGDEEKGHFTFDIDNCGLVAVPEGTVYTSDNCTIVSYSFDKDSFDCNDYPTTTVNLTATDQSGNSTTVPVEVTVEDNIAPTAIALDYITVSLGADGTVTIDPSQVDGGSYDNTACITLSLDQTTFDCEDVGRGSSFYVYSEEESCKGHKHTHGKGHNYDDDDESNDPGRGRAYGHKKTRKSRLKGHRVTLTITDAAGNTDQVESYVVVEDQLAPEIAAGPVTLVVYNETSTYYKKERVRDGKKWKWEYVEYTKVDEKYEYLKDEDIEPLVTDNCGVYKVYFDKQKYGVEDAGINQLQVTARDYNGNMSTGMVSINVIDITGLGEYVDMCYNGETKQVKQDKVQDYLRKGAVLGSCNLNMGASDFGLGEPAKPEGEELFIAELTLESYPNPTAGMTYMKISSNISGPARLALMSTSGVEMDELYKGDLEANTEIEVGYDAAHLPSGVYIVRLVTAGQVRNLKLMVKK
ncbi:MAG: T9SS type A sorting domain-containing protein, partial [Cytophagia bacterium]|nr:T9SS type A sorting domain-containing protein [Cytophagia bacterium]